MRGNIDHDVADAQQRRVRALAPARPQRGAHARQQFRDAERLGDVIIGAEIERRDLLGLLLARRQHDDRRVARLPRANDHRLAVHIRQPEVEHDGVRLEFVDLAKGLAPGRRLRYRIAARHQRRLQKALDLRLVIDNQYSLSVRHLDFKPPASPARLSGE